MSLACTLEFSVMNNLTIRLDRGLGNQLFTLTAGLCLGAINNASRIKIDTRGQFTEQMTRNSSVLDFDFDFRAWKNKSDINWRSGPSDNATVFMERALHRTFRGVKSRSKLIRQYRSLEYGFDPRLLEINFDCNIWGNYQTPVYSDTLHNLGLFPNISILRPTNWFKEKSEIIRSVPTLGIHLRRGDYVNYSKDLGLLSQNYYFNILRTKVARSQIPDRIAVFSNDLVFAKDFAERLKNTLDVSVSVLDPPPDSTSAESMLLLSYCKEIATANSTWSWWAAYLSHASAIYIPDPWFRNYSGNFMNQFPSSWRRSSSAFEQT